MTSRGTFGQIRDLDLCGLDPVPVEDSTILPLVDSAVTPVAFFWAVIKLVSVEAVVTPAFEIVAEPTLPVNVKLIAWCPNSYSRKMSAWPQWLAL